MSTLRLSKRQAVGITALALGAAALCGGAAALQRGAAECGVTGPRLEAGDWLLRADVECGNAGTIERTTQKDHFLVAPREDPLPIEIQKTGPISNYVLYVEITNRAPETRPITLDVLIPAWLIRERFDYFLRKPYLWRRPESLDWQAIAPENQSSLEDRVRLRLHFAAGERKILSTAPAYPYSAVRPKLSELEKRWRGKARVVEIGQSLEGRPIWSLEIGNRKRPRAVFSATLQPGEPSAWAILAMAEAMASNPQLHRFQKEFDLAFVPMTNPDGVVHGSCNVNSKGELVLLGFPDVVGGKPGFHEARVLWKYLAAKPPTFFIDFHFLQLPNHPIPTVYIFDPMLYSDPLRRGMAQTQARRLEKLSGAQPREPIGKDHPMWKGLATYHAILQWNTVSNLYQYTGPTTSHQGAQTRGVEVMRTVLDPGYQPQRQ